MAAPEVIRARLAAAQRAWVKRNPDKKREYVTKYRAAHPEKRAEESRRRRIKFPLKDIFDAKRGNAQRSGIEFSLVYPEMHWPEYCPVLGIQLNYSPGQWGHGTAASPSFDRLDYSKGYSPDNVLIVSHQANSLRSDRSLERLRDLAPRSPNHTKVYKFYSTLFSSLQKQPECT